MLTGDIKKTAELIAKETGVDEYYAQLLPCDKVTKLEQIMSKYQSDSAKKGSVVFAGDGINDAPVLTRADVGIAMGAMGTDAAIEAADVVIMQDDLSKLPVAIRGSRKTLRVVKENIAFSISVKVAVLILSALGLSNMWLAVFADVGVCLLAILNSLRALKV
jgi:Cd2+/Zn2+-exporting ATPase